MLYTNVYGHVDPKTGDPHPPKMDEHVLPLVETNGIALNLGLLLEKFTRFHQIFAS